MQACLIESGYTKNQSNTKLENSSGSSIYNKS